MSLWLPDQLLETATLNEFPEDETWPDFRQRLTVWAGRDSTLERKFLESSRLWISAQKHRRTYLRGMPKTIAREDTVALRIAVRDIRRYRDKIAAELDALRTSSVSPQCLAVLEEEICFSDDYILYIEEALQARGASGRSKVDEIVDPISSKIQLKIALKKKFDELKQDSPAELRADLEKAFRQALDQLDKQ